MCFYRMLRGLHQIPFLQNLKLLPSIEIPQQRDRIWLGVLHYKYQILGLSRCAYFYFLNFSCTHSIVLALLGHHFILFLIYDFTYVGVFLGSGNQLEDSWLPNILFCFWMYCRIKHIVLSIWKLVFVGLVSAAAEFIFTLINLALCLSRTCTMDRALRGSRMKGLRSVSAAFSALYPHNGYAKLLHIIWRISMRENIRLSTNNSCLNRCILG